MTDFQVQKIFKKNKGSRYTMRRVLVNGKLVKLADNYYRSIQATFEDLPDTGNWNSSIQVDAQRAKQIIAALKADRKSIKSNGQILDIHIEA